MKKTFFGCTLCFLLAVQAAIASTAVFTNDTVVSPLNTNYDGLDVVISNCVVAVDGRHSFASVKVAGGGTLTHSASADGLISITNAVADEPQVLIGTNAVLLASSNVIGSSVVVKDLSGLVTYTNALDYVLNSLDTLTTLQRTETSSIPDGATVLASYNYIVGTNESGLTLTVTGNVDVDSGGAINSNGRGCGANHGSGPGGLAGSPLSGGGGGYGGYGGSSSSNAPGGNSYGSLFLPLDVGSGGGSGSGGPGGAGGGLIRLDVGGRLAINGSVAANGNNATNSRSGGGSGGSIWLSAQTIAGTGAVSADGGAGEPIHGGGGGGGRIAIYSDTNLFAGSVMARGGLGFVTGGAGTIFTRTNSLAGGLVLADNGGRIGTNTPLPTFVGLNLTVAGGAAVVPANSTSLGSLLIGTAGRLICPNQQPIFVSVAGDAIIQSGGSITGDGAGYSAGNGSGTGGTLTGTTNYGGGAGHGGRGGNGGRGGYDSTAAGGTPYGVITAPSVLGSGGGGRVSSTYVGGAGGGALRLMVNGRLVLDGRISVDGRTAVTFGGGGGSGGSIWLNAGTLSGSGAISANGGNGYWTSGDGGGGGGRIAVEYATNSFAGTMTAFGGSGLNWGGAGTVYLKSSSPNGQLQVDNNGHAGAGTPVTQSMSDSVNPGIVVRGAATLLMNYSQTLGSLFVASNSWLITTSTVPTLTVAGNAIIESGGGIIADGGGYSGGSGSGAGNSYGTGGGYGGYGGAGTNGVAGGLTYGSATQPNSSGSGGNPYASPYNGGGSGGGIVGLTVQGTLTLNGKISVNGGSGYYSNPYYNYYPCGGGSGGSIGLVVGTLSGSGVISANGGSGAVGGGGGGGGRIGIRYGTNLFSGVITAYGGNGHRAGGAGTIYTGSMGPSGSSSGTLLVDNGGLAGTNTPVAGLSSVDDLTVQGNGVAVVSGGTIRNLLILSNGWLTAASGANVTVNNNATVQAGGGIVVDGKGVGGNGPGYSSTKGGGGHGGYGAINPSGYGLVYGSIQSPTTSGSSGGGGVVGAPAPSGGGVGGRGGGIIRLIVSRVLTVNGRVSADGSAGDLNGGGGSGGSVWLTMGTLAGTGVISANGGSGVGGGGGGGRISITYSTNAYSGSLSAYGGGGTVCGGAGTIYTKANTASAGQVRVDNGGLSGTNTPLSSAFGLPASPFNLAVQGGAIVHFPSPPVPLMSNLVVSSGGLITTLPGQTGLTLGVMQNVSIGSGGMIGMDGKGYPIASGPGAGSSLNAYKGSGGGYGGVGGASSAGSPGGTNYGSASRPSDPGSGGGAGAVPYFGGSGGGGALRLTAGGTLTVDGRLGANGDAGLMDDSGGGSGGSIWVSARAVAGSGVISAAGGGGELYGGGGGGGGRIAIYSPANSFSGFESVAGGDGAAPGQPGTLFGSTNYAALQITAHSPSGVASIAVSYVDFTINEVVGSVSASSFALFTPAGPVAQSNLTASVTGLFTVRAAFPAQNLVGDYRIEVGTNGVFDLFGSPLSQVYTGAFTVALPAISGMVITTNGSPVAGVSVLPSGGYVAATTDLAGQYSVGVPIGWSGSLTPSLATNMFVPGSLDFTNVTDTITNQNFLMVNTIAPTVMPSVSGANLRLNWSGLQGVTYQVLWSTNMLQWLPYGSTITGSNGLMEFSIPMDGDRYKFFWLEADN